MSESPAQFALRTLRALEVLAFGPTTAPRLAETLGVHPRTARRLLSQLQRDGWLSYSTQSPRVYAPTLRFVALAAHIGAPAVERLHVARAPLATLSDTGLEASLAVPAYNGTVCIVRCCGDSTVQPPLGEAPPAHCTAPGKALLAHREPWCRAVLGAPLP